MKSKLDFNFSGLYFVGFGNEVCTSYLRDILDFEAFSPIYGSAHYQNLLAKLTECDARINPQSIMVRQKANTAARRAILDMVSPFTLKLAVYLELAKLDVTAEDLKLAEIRKYARNGNANSVSPLLKDVRKLLLDSISPLTKAGYSTEKQEMLDNYISTLDQSLKQKGEIDDEREILVLANRELLNETFGIIKKVLETGKAIYADNAAKKKDYTATSVLKRVTRAQKKEDSSSTSATKKTVADTNK